ncbi:hypothetical protein H310_03581 [Aphanomyces invadans]|uniref:BD-FAE-like domain-containing protein n=1 Tax=Aphanomyces invadans TaxID=157072 RepID=A0A024UJD3_9STRA|nr:hypothetical protein H310_03581 [Aphanomyces invadans]ETW05947.1 hypothetical protein H310_03581 [Aphanomyces invadans]|eukprot:XP_008865724.1 hypothetical protein H310_03581 [Aphanomyces invadans]
MLGRALQRRSIYIWRDIPYTDKAHPRQMLDVVVPTAPTFPRAKLPVTVFVHGGAWQRGDKNGPFYAHVARTIAQSTSTLAVTMNYRLSPEVMYPEHIRDVLHALQWVHREIHKFGGDNERIVLMGHSAGAHSVIKLALDDGIDFPNCPQLTGVIGISGVYNIVRLSTASIFGSMALDPVFGVGVQARREASVLQPFAGGSRRLGTKAHLPILLLYAQDDFHLDDDALEVKAWLDSVGFTNVTSQEIPRVNHFSIIGNVTPDLPMSPSTEAISKFIRDTTTQPRCH